MKPLAELATDLAAGRTSAEALTEAALARIDDPSGEGVRAFMTVYHEASMAAARASDAARAHGVVPSPLAGIPVSIKDLCDVAGEVTLAGSIVRQDAEPATADAPTVARLRAAGAIVMGRTNMVEFAMGGLGTNDHYGTPKNPYDRATGRVPGGSTSGGAVSVSDGMAAAALGTDTAGSVRIPAALCGMAGFKPTARRVPKEGIYPLSRTLDSVGPLAPTVACCALVDAIFAGEAPAELKPIELRGLRFAVPKHLVLDDLDEAVTSGFQRALSRLSEAGAQISEIDFPELARIPVINRIGGFSTAEAYALHREVLDRAGNQYDRNVAARINLGSSWSAAEYLDLIDIRADVIASAHERSAPFDAVVMPTTPIIACPIEEVADGEVWADRNKQYLRNTILSNFLDRCSLTVPCHDPGEAPVGFMLVGEAMADHRLLDIGAAVEGCIAPPLT